jgi:hydroxypyruvate isomerase
LPESKSVPDLQSQAPRRAVSVHLNYILGHLPLNERFAAARGLGFSAVEFPFPYATPAAQYRDWLQENGLTQISIGAPACDYQAGAPGFSLSLGLKSMFDRSLDTAIAYAKVIDCRSVHVFAGGRPADMDEDAIFDTYAQNLNTVRSRLRAEGLNLVVEAINATDFKGYFMNRLDRFLALTDRIGGEGLGLVLDLYHAAVNHEDPVAFLLANPGLIRHIQLADFPGRHEPGTGAVDFDALFAAIASSGYTGSLGLEYVPTRPISDGVPLADLLFGHLSPA